MLGEGHELDMGVVHLLQVVDEFDGEFAVAERTVGVFHDGLPGAEVQFVNGEGFFAPVGLGALCLPVGIAPGVAAEFFDNGGVVGGGFKAFAVGVGLEPGESLTGADLEFVLCTGGDAGDKEFPDAGGTEAAHGVVAPVPVIEFADYGDALGTGGPDGKGNALHAVDLAQVGAHLFMGLTVVALIEEVDGVVGEAGKKAVGVEELADFTVVALDPQAVVEAFAAGFDEALEKTVTADSFKGIAGTVGYGDIDDLATLGVIDKSADNECAFSRAFAGVHTQNRVRLAAGHLGD